MIQIHIVQSQNTSTVMMNRSDDMRWRSKWDYIHVGQTRKITKFLLFPKKINREWRWLEKATYLQKCFEEMNYATMDYGYHKVWRDIAWIKKN